MCFLCFFLIIFRVKTICEDNISSYHSSLCVKASGHNEALVTGPNKAFLMYVSIKLGMSSLSENGPKNDNNNVHALSDIYLFISYT